MARLTSILTTGLLAGLLPPLVAAAQAPLAAGVPVGCTYATCALRVEPAFFGPRLVRGASGEVVSRLGGFGGGVDSLLAGPDSAAAYGREYVRASQISGALGLIGALAYVVTVVRSENSQYGLPSDADAATMIAGAGFLVASIPFGVRAQRSLSRAIWWYNAALPR